MFRKKMWLKRNNLITFSENDKVIVIDSQRYDNREFYLVQKVLSDESDITNKCYVMEAFAIEGTLQKLTDVELLLKLKPAFIRKSYRYSERVAQSIHTYFNSIESYTQMNRIDEAYKLKDYQSLHRMAYDDPTAVSYLKNDAEQGILAAKHWYAMLYDDGYGVEENLDTAFKLMKESAECGYPESVRELARMYDAEPYGGFSDHERAVYWYKKALQYGFKNVAFNLSLKYKYGLGVRKDLEEAKRLEQIYYEWANSVRKDIL